MKDDDGLIAIGRNAGRQDVLRVIAGLVSNQLISGDPRDLIRPEPLTPHRRFLMEMGFGRKDKN